MNRGVRSQSWACLLRATSAALVVCTTTAITLHGQGFIALHSFDQADGEFPVQGLVQGTDGNLYGVTELGGAYSDGTVFRITPGGILTTVHSFESTDGSSPWPLSLASNGVFYGTTYGGGLYGEGTVFRMTPSGTVSTLYNFCPLSGCPDGSKPYAGLIPGIDGNLYGTTQLGGAYASGTVFKITPNGTFTTLYSFCAQQGCPDGSGPQASLVLGTDGDLYGVTTYGGPTNNGTIFKITSRGRLTTLYSFCRGNGCTDGANPISLVHGSDGDFYGTAQAGGVKTSCRYGCGTVFKMTFSGTLTRLYAFCSQGGSCPDGSIPYGLEPGTDGNFYGTTANGGNNGGCTSGCGTTFSITPDGQLTTLANFDYVNGAYPYLGGLVQHTNGDFYGSGFEGGSSGACSFGCGTVFVLSVGLGPFVETEPAFGKVGAVIAILGTDLAGATSVTFNGIAAVFTVESPTAVKATVPDGATTGTVQVITPHGTLNSNVVFRVGP